MAGGVFFALSDPTRRRILELLRDDDRTAGELGDHFDLAPSTMSRHFTVLRDAGLIRGERSGTTITYQLNLSVLEDALVSMLDAFSGTGAARQDRERPAERGTVRR